jgi:Ca-activated chloride channel homolog
MLSRGASTNSVFDAGERPLKLATLIIAAVVFSSVPRAQSPQATFVSASSDLVVLPVTVTDKRGSYVPNVARDRFAVFDNGRPQSVTLFRSDDTPVSVALVIDSSGSMGPKLPDVIVATLNFARSSNPSDELYVVPFNDTVYLADSEEASRPFLISNVAALESGLRSLVPLGRTALYDAVILALDRVESGAQPRKAIVVVSDGGDNASRATLDDVLARAKRSNVTIFTIGLFDPDGLDKNPGVLKSLAVATGGQRFLPKSPDRLVQACEQIARELRSGYTLGYVPPDRDGGYHQVRVEISAPGSAKLVARTRPGYVAPGPSK